MAEKEQNHHITDISGVHGSQDETKGVDIKNEKYSSTSRFFAFLCLEMLKDLK